MKKILLLVFLSLFFICCKSQQESNDYLIDFEGIDLFHKTKESGIVINDYGNIIPNVNKLELATLLKEYNDRTSREIVVVTIDSITPYQDIQVFATDLGNYWGVGDSDKDNGVLIAVCKPCRSTAIATGYGTEKMLTDELCKQVIDEIMIPKFKKDNYGQGISEAVNQLIELWEE